MLGNVPLISRPILGKGGGRFLRGHPVDYNGKMYMKIGQGGHKL